MTRFTPLLAIFLFLVLMAFIFLCSYFYQIKQMPIPIHAIVISQSDNGTIEAVFEPNTTLKAGTKYIIILDGLEK